MLGRLVLEYFNFIEKHYLIGAWFVYENLIIVLVFSTKYRKTFL